LFSRQAGCNLEFLLLPLITAVAFYIGPSLVETFPLTPDGMCIYASLAAYPSTGKSNAMSKVRKSFDKVENFYNIPPEKSQIINAPTVSLTALLDNFRNVIGNN